MNKENLETSQEGILEGMTPAEQVTRLGHALRFSDALFPDGESLRTMGTDGSKVLGLPYDEAHSMLSDLLPDNDQ